MLSDEVQQAGRKMPLIDLVTKDPEELVARLSSFFLPLDVRLGKEPGALDAGLRVASYNSLSFIDLWFGAPVVIKTDPFRDYYMINTCVRGNGSLRWGHDQALLQPNVSVPISAATSGTDLFSLGPGFRQRSVRISRETLHGLFARWTGRPVEGELRFEFKPFDEGLNARWSHAMALLDGNNGVTPLSPIAQASLEEYALALLVECHPHNFQRAMTIDSPVVPRLVRDAENFIERNAANPITIVDVANAVGCSVRSLQSGFRQYRDTTPHAYLTSMRLARARDALIAAGPGETVASIALDLGFTHLGRFSAAFAARYGDRPANLLRRARIS